MQKLLEILESRKGFFESASLPEVQVSASEVVASECCDTNCGECDC
jgi:hypothetical protein